MVWLFGFIGFIGFIGIIASGPSLAQPLQSGLHVSSSPLNFIGSDFYLVTGGPDLQVTLDRSTVYQNDMTSIFLTVQNNGHVTSFKVFQQPNANRPDEIFAAQKELSLENQRSVAQGVSVQLQAENSSAFNVKRTVAYAGNVPNGQVSQRLEFPIEIYQNTAPGEYQFYVTLNYTYQEDVSVIPYSDRPENPDIYYLYATAYQVIPITVTVERKSGVDIKALNTTPSTLDIGSKNNILNVFIKNIGTDTAKDLVARLTPETGLYVDTDESPIPYLFPGQVGKLSFKVDVSKDAVGERPYQFSLIFDYQDSYRKNLQDTDNVYVTIVPSLTARYWWVAAITVAVLILAALLVIRRRRRSASGE